MKVIQVQVCINHDLLQNSYVVISTMNPLTQNTNVLQWYNVTDVVWMFSNSSVVSIFV